MKEPTEKESPPSTEPGIDASHHPDGAFDDPLHDWWKQNGRSILSGAALAILATAAVFGFRAYRHGQLEDLQNAYNEAFAADSLETFAVENAGHPLAGIAALQTANGAFEENDWDLALEQYTVAVDSLSDNPLRGKARLGLAVTRLKRGENVEATQILEGLATDENAFRAARAEATYFLALTALSLDDKEAFSQWSDTLPELDPMSVWQNRLQYYRERVEIPVTEEPAADGAENPSDTDAVEETGETVSSEEAEG